MARSLQLLVSGANRWRDQYNPLRGLTIARAISLLEAGQHGEFADLQWTYEFIEQTDPDLLTLVERRTAALTEMDWDIKIVNEEHDSYDKTLAEDQAGELREAYERLDNLYGAMAHFELAAFRGFSIAQMHRGDGEEIAHIETLNHWNFARDGRDGDWYWNPTAKAVPARSLSAEDKLEPGEVMIYETRRPIDRIGLIKFVRSNLSEKDWDGYVEIYGIPSWIIIGPDNVPDGKETEYRDAAEDVAAGGSGYLPYGSTADAADTPRGSQPFEVRLEWLTKKLVLAGTGGLLTVLAESGSGTLAGGAHMEAFRMIARMDAGKMSEFFQATIDTDVYRRKFPDKPRLAYFDIAAEEEQDVGEVVEQIAALSQFYIIEPSQVQEKTGYNILGLRPQPSPAGAPLGPAQHRLRATHRNTVLDARSEKAQDQIIDLSVEAALLAEREDLRPLADRLYTILALDDAQAMYAELTRLREDLPALAPALLDHPALAEVIYEAISPAALNGMAESNAARPAEGGEV
ncbi:MAG: DUF935 family protein [Lentisphaerae bacterium]|nr:DUF935 family protein [Lentisphaerota bacterium]